MVILRKIKSVRKVWRKKENEYITITEDFFDGFQFQKGKYIAYASIINCNPRFLEPKTFQFFYKKPLADAIYTIAHELLHFIFFDFIKKKLKKKQNIYQKISCGTFQRYLMWLCLNLRDIAVSLIKNL